MTHDYDREEYQLKHIDAAITLPLKKFNQLMEILIDPETSMLTTIYASEGDRAARIRVQCLMSHVQSAKIRYSYDTTVTMYWENVQYVSRHVEGAEDVASSFIENVLKTIFSPEEYHYIAVDAYVNNMNTVVEHGTFKSEIPHISKALKLLIGG